jgi:hypothetical protein
MDRAIDDFRAIGSPIFVAHNVANAAQNLPALVTDRSQAAGQKIRGHCAGREEDGLGRLFLRPDSSPRDAGFHGRHLFLYNTEG